MGFYSARRYRGFRGFGDVAEAQDAVQIAQAKVAATQAKITAQKRLVSYTQVALKNCSENEGNIVGNILSGGVSAAICIADQTNQLGQRRGILVQFEGELDAARAELASARSALDQARSMPADVEVSPGVVHPGSTVGYVGSAQTGSGGGLMDLFSNPLVLGGAAIVGLGAAFLVFRKG